MDFCRGSVKQRCLGGDQNFHIVRGAGPIRVLLRKMVILSTKLQGDTPVWKLED
jgi:hypothetical protein